MDETYNGYKNYETFIISLWLDNDRGEYERFKELSKELEVYELAKEIKEYIEEYNPIAGQCSAYSDLLQGAIDTADFYEIAETFYEK